MVRKLFFEGTLFAVCLLQVMGIVHGQLYTIKVTTANDNKSDRNQPVTVQFYSDATWSDNKFLFKSIAKGASASSTTLITSNVTKIRFCLKPSNKDVWFVYTVCRASLTCSRFVMYLPNVSMFQSLVICSHFLLP